MINYPKHSLRICTKKPDEVCMYNNGDIVYIFKGAGTMWFVKIIDNSNLSSIDTTNSHVTDEFLDTYFRPLTDQEMLIHKLKHNL